MARSLQRTAKNHRYWAPCTYCGIVCDSTLDHVIPKCRGGRIILLSCESCNHSKADMSLRAWSRVLTRNAPQQTHLRKLTKLSHKQLVSLSFSQIRKRYQETGRNEKETKSIESLYYQSREIRQYIEKIKKGLLIPLIRLELLYAVQNAGEADVKNLAEGHAHFRQRLLSLVNTVEEDIICEPNSENAFDVLMYRRFHKRLKCMLVRLYARLKDMDNRWRQIHKYEVGWKKELHAAYLTIQGKV